MLKNLATDKFYIGSAVHIKDRWRMHVKDLNRGSHSNAKLQRAWIKYGFLSFIFKVLEYCEKENLLKREQYYLDLYKAVDFGYNLQPTAGSGLGRLHTEEEKRLISLRRKGHPTSDATRLFLSLLNKGRVISDEARKKMSIAAKGKKKSDETRRKMSASKMGHPVSDETRKKLSKPQSEESKENKRKPHSEEVRTRMSLYPRRNLSKETVEKMSFAKKNMSDDTKLKMSLAKKQWWIEKRKKEKESIL